MDDTHFEIIVTGRQLAALIAGVAVAVVVAFGAGVGVGLLQPGSQTTMVGQADVSSAIVSEPLVQDSNEGAPPPSLGAKVHAAGRREASGDVGTPSTVSESRVDRGVDGRPAGAETADERRPIAVRSPEPAATEVPQPTPEPTAVPALPTRTAQLPQHLSTGEWVQVGALSRAGLAEGLRQRVIAFGFRPEQVIIMPTEDGRFRVRLGPFPDRESAGRVVARIRTEGFPDAFVVSE